MQSLWQEKESRIADKLVTTNIFTKMDIGLGAVINITTIIPRVISQKNFLFPFNETLHAIMINVEPYVKELFSRMYG